VQNLESIFIGIVAGILTTIFILLVKSFFYRIIIPWYLSITYKGVDLAGKWTAKADDHTFTLELKQNAHDMKGVLVISENREEKIDNSSHYIKGEVWEGYISLHSSTVDKRELSFGNLLLKVESGRLIKGMYTARRFFENEAVGILSTEVSFERSL
jgi:hypothetical protein